jgi:hypothetical protein
MRSQALGTMLIWLCFCGDACADSAPEPNPGPIQAELMAGASVHRLETGATIFARVTQDWKGPDCVLRSGAILEGTVEIADPRKGRGESKLALSFNRAQCNGLDLKPMSLLLSAVAGPPAEWENVPDAVFKMPVMFMQPNGMSGFGGAGIGGFSLSHMELKGIIHRFPMSPKLQPGDVLEIKGMKLELGTGPNRSSVLSTRNRDVSLDPFTQFLLVPSALVFRRVTLAVPVDPAAAASPTGAREGRPLPADAVPVSDLEVCAPPGCAVDLPVGAKEVEGHEGTSIALGALGFVPRSRRVLGDFADEEVVAWLSPQQLLFAFNPHVLIRREGGQASNETRRMIRAVLLNAQSGAVVRAVDWEITDARRYLWQLDENHILVHIGNELRIYGAGLEMERSFAFAGQLAFVRIAPNGKLLAVATLEERHTPELHAKLHVQLGAEPEEDVNVAILDRDFKTIAHAETVSGLQPPTLLNEGQVNLLSQPKMQYRLALNPWNSKPVTLARIASRCTPDLSSLAPDLLFLMSCNVATGATEYRVLGADGKLLLRGEAGPREVGHDVVGDPGHGMFAMKAVHAVHELTPGIEFRAADLESEELRVYRAADGKRVLAVRVGEPVASHGGYALSPDGSQLAVLSESQIQFFPLPAQ